MRILEDMAALGLAEGEVLVKNVGKSWLKVSSRCQGGLGHGFRASVLQVKPRQ